MFEEQLLETPCLTVYRAVECAQLMIAAGSSLEVSPAAGLPIIALYHGAK